MRKNILLYLSLALFSLTSSAQEAKQILDELSDKAANYKSMEADFSYRMLNDADGIDEMQKGSILTSGEKYNLEIAGQKIISDGKTVWTVIEDAEEVQISNVPEEDEAAEEYISPTKILTLWEKGFKYKYVGSENLNGAAHHLIDLFPEDPSDKSFHTIKLFINKAKMEVTKINIKGKDGTDYIYSIDEFNVNGNIAEGQFTFNKPNYDVIDLR